MPENFKSLMTCDVDVKPLEKAEHLSLHGGNEFQSKSVQPACRDETSVWQLPRTFICQLLPGSSEKKRHKYVSVCVFQRVLHSSPVKHSPFLVTLIKYFVRLLQSVFIIRGKSPTTQQFNNFVRLQDLTIDPATGTPAVQHRLL